MDLISKYCYRECEDHPSGKKCKECGQEVNSKSNKVEVEDNACKGTYDDMPDKELHYFLMGDDEDFDQSNFDRESSIEQAEDLCNEAEVMGSFDENGDAI